MRHLFLINPPERKGYSNERSQSAGLGVSRKLKPFEKQYILLPAPDIMMTAAVAEKCGLNVQILDMILENQYGDAASAYVKNRIQSAVSSDNEVWICVRLSIATLPQDLHFANQIKEALPQSRLFLIGSVIMATVDHWIKDTKADAILFGEPEAIVGAMFEAKGGAWKRQKGVVQPNAYLPIKGDGLYDGSVQNKFHDWVLNDNLSEIPFPAYHLLPMERYSASGDPKDLAVYVTASRGCPIGCTMCPYMLHEGRPLRISAVERVLSEMEWLNQTWGITHWRFRDPNFGFDKKQARELLTQIIERGIKMEATVETSLECMDDSLIELMAKAGIKVVTTGIETADEECLSSIGQKIKINDILAKKISYADSLGIHVYGTFVIGAPEESWKTVERTIAYSKTIPCECAFTVMTPFPGTPMYYQALKEGLLEKEMTYEKWNSYEATVKSRFLTPEELSLARLWARLELIVPYRRYYAKKTGANRLKEEIKLTPHKLALFGVRLLVGMKKRKANAASSLPELKHDKLVKTPLHWQSEEQKAVSAKMKPTLKS